MGLYTITSRATGTVLTGFYPPGNTSNVFNADHENHVTHTEPESINSYEPDVPTMNFETAPAPANVPSLPAAFSDELRRLRFALSTLKRIITGATPPHWYTAVGNLTAVVQPPAVACRRSRTTSFNIPSDGSVTIDWETTPYDTVGTMAPSSVGIRAPDAGIYLVGGSLAIGTDTTGGDVGDFYLTLTRAGDGDIAENQSLTATDTIPKAVSVETIAHFNKNQVLTMSVTQNNASVVASATTPAPSLYMALIAR